MVIVLSAGKLILTPTELLCRLSSGATLRALPDDIRLVTTPPLLIADAGAVSWTLPILAASTNS